MFANCILVNPSTSPFVILGVSGLFCRFYFILFDGKMLLANSEDPDQTPHYVASDLGLRCFPLTLFLVSNGSVGTFVLFMPCLTEGTTGLITCVIPLATKLFKIRIISYKKEFAPREANSVRSGVSSIEKKTLSPLDLYTFILTIS